MSEIELKACPFCGAKPVMRERSGDERNGYNTSLTLECRCGVSIETETQNKGGLPTETVAAAKRRLRATWNTRASQWQPIESAPKDGTFYLATNGKDQRVENCPDGYVAGIWSRIDGDWCGFALGNDSTHWQPLPAPPEVEG